MGQIALLEKRGSRVRMVNIRTGSLPPSMRRKSGVCMAEEPGLKKALKGRHGDMGRKTGDLRSSPVCKMPRNQRGACANCIKRTAQFYESLLY